VIAAGRVDIIEAPYSLLDQRAAERLFPLAQRHHVSIIARTPLASGALSGRWHTAIKFHRADWRRRVFRGEVLERTVQRVSQVRALFEPGVALAQAALRFCLSHPAVSTVIPGVRTAEQVVCNLAVSEQGALLPEQLEQIGRLWREELHQQVRTSIGEEGEGYA
jgi:aryl-alcohol dehydrogenase-like predicted oxidoreductase